MPSVRPHPGGHQDSRVDAGAVLVEPVLSMHPTNGAQSRSTSTWHPTPLAGRVHTLHLRIITMCRANRSTLCDVLNMDMQGCQWCLTELLWLFSGDSACLLPRSTLWGHSGPALLCLEPRLCHCQWRWVWGVMGVCSPCHYTQAGVAMPSTWEALPLGGGRMHGSRPG
jgi:hypothetical protein